MTGIRRTTQQERDETPSERADRNYAELVQELRVSQTGVQILFAFLLMLAFTAAFPHDRDSFDYVLTGALITASASAVCFMAPVAIHRMLFRLGGKERIVFVTHRFALAGLVLLGISMLLAVWIVIAFLFGDGTATTLVALLAVLIVGTWGILPWRLRSRERALRMAQSAQHRRAPGAWWV